MTPLDLITVHTTGGPTGNFRIRKGRPLEAEITITAAMHRGPMLLEYTLWRPATEGDHAECASRRA